MSLVQSILTAFANALSLVFAFVPKLIGFLIILLIGWLIATALSKGITLLLRKIGFDRIGERIGLNRLERQMGLTLDAAGLLGQIIYWFVFLIFLVPAVDTLGLTAVSNILNSLITYIPNVFVAIIVLFLGALAANFVGGIVEAATASANVGNSRAFAAITRYAILGFVAIVALEQLQIAPALLNILFTSVIGSAALAFGLAFGLGGQDTARRFLARGERSLTEATSLPEAQTIEQQRVNPSTQFTPTATPHQY